MEISSTRNRGILNMFNRFQKIFMQTLIKPYLLWYLNKERKDKVCGFELVIRPTVFHPKYFFSSTYLFDFISTLNLVNKQFLEIGCGSGLISLLAYQKKAIVSTCDINQVAIDCTKLNFEKNFGKDLKNLSIVSSDLFDAVPVFKFDTIVINPPYFFEDVKANHQLAWNCGKNGEYFVKLFSELEKFIHAESGVYMILADNCDVDQIKDIAKLHRFVFELIVHKKIKWEVNYIFKISLSNVS
jgi:release factor glutamine methyltransferase